MGRAELCCSLKATLPFCTCGALAHGMQKKRLKIQSFQLLETPNGYKKEVRGDQRRRDLSQALE